MKLRKTAALLIITILIAMQCNLPVFATQNDTLTFTDDILNVISDVEYGAATQTYRFEENILAGVREGDDVLLIADAKYDHISIGDTNITLTNFRLEGEQASRYHLADIPEQVVKKIKIKKRTIKISPKQAYVYFGQEKPKETKEIADYTSQLVAGESLNLQATFMIQTGEEINENYAVWLDGEIIQSGKDANNYQVILDPKAKFSIRAYEAAQQAVIKRDENKKRILFTAPKGFSISDQQNGEWKSSIEYPLSDKPNDVVTYYLKNDTKGLYYQAISKQIYEFGQPVIQSMMIEKNDQNSKLNLMSYGVFGNGSVKIRVEAIGSTVEEETILHLGKGKDDQSKVAEAKFIDGIYHYTAEFTLMPETDSTKTKQEMLHAYAVNISGESEKFTKITGLSDHNDQVTSVDSKPFVLEKVERAIDVKPIKGDSKKIDTSFSINGVTSGIASVEYGWDLNKDLCDAEKNEESGSGHEQGFAGNKYSDAYVPYDFTAEEIKEDMTVPLTLLLEDSVRAKDDRHTLYVRITDNAGNIYNRVYQDPIGIDMYKPIIKHVEIRKTSEAQLTPDIRYLTTGTFSKYGIEVAVQVEDDQHVVASDISSVHLAGRNMIKNNQGEYVLTITPDDYLKGVKIIAQDGAGWENEAFISDIPNAKGTIKSNDIVVEDNEALISFQSSHDGYKDKQGRTWYGLQEMDEYLTLHVIDEPINSGFYSIKVWDNDIIKFEKTGFADIENELSQRFVFGDLAEGEHIFTVEAEDNAGNIHSAKYTFYIDHSAPDQGSIVIDQQGGTSIDDKQWFDRDDIITFRIHSSDAISAIGEITLNVNDQKYVFTKDDILTDDKGQYVIIDTSNAAIDHKQSYTITGTVSDYAKNAMQLEPLTIYKDFENPVIEKFTVKKQSNALDKILHVLTFGVYSNDTLEFEVEASDAEYDSGVDYVTVLYNGLTEPVKMTKEENGKFTIEIKPEMDVFESDIVVTAYDKFGKASTSCPNLEDALSNDKSNGIYAMIDTNKPTFDLTLPDGDGVKRDDGQTWYNANKPILLNLQDEHSGIRDVAFTVNGVNIPADKNGTKLLKADVTSAMDSRIITEQKYEFDTDYLTSLAKESLDGKYVIAIQIMDNAGNMTTYERTYYIDKAAPEIVKIDFTPITSDGKADTKEFIEQFEYGYYFKTDFNLTIHVSDQTPSSGLHEVKYRFVPYQNGVQQTEITGSQKIIDGKVVLIAPKDFKGQIFVEAFDNVLNHSKEKTVKAFVVDNIAPDIQITDLVSTKYHDANNNDLYIEDNQITVTISDSVSGIKEIGYYKKAEQNAYDRIAIPIENKVYKVGDVLKDGWVVTAVDMNLVTSVSKTFTFQSDDNDVMMVFDATDHALNKTDNIKSKTFTVDKTKPVINVVFRNDTNETMYYKQDRVADIIVTERNFNADRMKVLIENTFGKVPSYAFTDTSKTEHTAVIRFDEGDYTFQASGQDLGEQEAIVRYSGGNENKFYVDKTLPVIEENFRELEKNNASF